MDRNVKYVIVCPEDLKHILFVYPAAHSILLAVVVVVVVVVALQLEMLSELKSNSGHSNYDRNFIIIIITNILKEAQFELLDP